MAKEIKDFGEYVFGARKDAFTENANLSDFAEMNGEEKLKYVVKDRVWKKPNYKKLYEKEGWDRLALFYYKTVRDAFPTKPEYGYRMTKAQAEDSMKQYIVLASQIQELLWHVRTEEMVGNSISRFRDARLNSGFYYRKVCNALGDSYSDLVKEMKHKQFLYTEDEKILSSYMIIPFTKESVSFEEDRGRKVLKYKPYVNRYYAQYFYPTGEFAQEEAYEEGKYFVIFACRDFFGMNYASKEEAQQAILESEKEKKKAAPAPSGKKRKTAFVPPALLQVERIADMQYLNGKHADGDMYMQDFHFKGGQFGNWMSDYERQQNMDMAYESFKDLAYILDIRDEDVTFDGRLSIAFGARGKGKAMAHYEPASEIINLTRMKGAGSLGHEWIHAVDRYAAQVKGIPGMMTEGPRYSSLESFKTLMNTIKKRRYTKEETVAYYKEQKELFLKKMRGEFLMITRRGDDEAAAKREDCIEALIQELDGMENYTNILPGKGRNLFVHDDKPSDAYRKLMEQQKEIQTGTASSKQNIRWYNAKRREAATYNENIKSGNRILADTDFVRQAKTIDAMHSKSDKGYWASDVELLARAGAAYIKDKCKEKGIRNDYLSGHADDAAAPGVYTSPRGKEREEINKAFDLFFEEMRENGYFGHHKEVKAPSRLISTPFHSMNTEQMIAVSFPYEDMKEESSGQMMLVW